MGLDNLPLRGPQELIIHGQPAKEGFSEKSRDEIAAALFYYLAQKVYPSTPRKLALPPS
jgi:hypothetical protein